MLQFDWRWYVFLAKCPNRVSQSMMQLHVGVLTEHSVCIVTGRHPYQPSRETEQVLLWASNNLLHSIGAVLN